MVLKTCKECLRTFHNKSTLNKHIKRAHSDEEESEEEVESEEGASDSEEMSDAGDVEEPWTVNIWEEMKQKSDTTNDSFLRVYKDGIIFANSLTRADTHREVMKTFKKARNEDDMDFEEALDFALDRRKFLTVREFEDDENDRYMVNESAQDDDTMY